MDIGKAIELLKQGELLRRNSWHDSRKFVFMQVPAEIGKDIVPKMQSLPQKAKNHFQKTFNDEQEQIDAIYYNNQIAEVSLSNSISGYTPSIEDILETDWEIVE